MFKIKRVCVCACVCVYDLLVAHTRMGNLLSEIMPCMLIFFLAHGFLPLRW